MSCNLLWPHFVKLPSSEMKTTLNENEKKLGHFPLGLGLKSHCPRLFLVLRTMRFIELLSTLIVMMPYTAS